MDITKCVVCKAELATHTKPELCPYCNNIVFFDEGLLDRLVGDIKRIINGGLNLTRHFLVFSLVMFVGMFGCIALWAGLQLIM